MSLPPFWPDRPALLFQAETQFEFASMTIEKTKFNQVISHLDCRHAAEVEDIITSPPENEPYTVHKTTDPPAFNFPGSRTQTAAHSRRDGDMKPSQLLRHLKNLAPDVPDDFLRSIWSGKLTPHIQKILAGQAEVNLDSASQLGDRKSEIAPLPTTAAVSLDTDLATLLKKTEELSRHVASLTTLRYRRRSRSRGRPSRSSSPPGEKPSQNSTLCCYHQHFDKQARKCTRPCSYNQQDTHSSGRQWRQPTAENPPAASSLPTRRANMIPDRHRLRPMRFPSETRARLQGTHPMISARPMDQPSTRTAGSLSKPRPPQRLHLAIHRSRRTNRNHPSGLPRTFQPPG